VTTTVPETTTRLVLLPTGTTTSSSSSSSSTPSWVWVLLGILAVGLIALIVVLARRGGGGGGGHAEGERSRYQLDSAVASWAAQGWAIESQTSDSAVLRRGGETMIVSVDEHGHVSTRPLPASPP
jgi:hypothetical protein